MMSRPKASVTRCINSSSRDEFACIPSRDGIGSPCTTNQTRRTSMFKSLRDLTMLVGYFMLASSVVAILN
jgi:hypothetical protein